MQNSSSFSSTNSKGIAAIVGVGPKLGRSIARKFAHEGYTVAILSRDLGRLSRIAEEIAREEKAQVFAIRIDCSDTRSISEAFEGVLSLGYVEVLVYNAAYQPLPLHPANFTGIPVNSFEKSLAVSSVGAFHCAQQILPGMVERGRGTILFTGCSASLNGMSGFSELCCGKFALRGLSQCLAREFQSLGIHVAHVIIDGLVGAPRNLKMDESGIAKVVPSTIDLNMEYQDEDSDYDSSDMDFDINSEPDFICDEVNDVLRDDDDANGTNESHPMLEKLAPPNVGMIFASYEDVIGYYHEFGKQNGFQMKIRSRENVKGTECGNKYDCKRLRLVCKKEGKFVPRGKDPSKPTRSEVTGCKAKITATFDKSSGEWKLTTVVLKEIIKD